MAEHSRGVGKSESTALDTEGAARGRVASGAAPYIVMASKGADGSFTDVRLDPNDGPLVVTPQISPRLKSHLKARVLERQVPSTPAAVKEQRHIYASMGPTIPK